MDKNSWLEKISPIIHCVGQAKHHPHWAEPNRVIYDSQLILFFQSDYIVETSDAKYHCPDGSFLIIPPGLGHVGRETQGLVGRRSIVLFDWSYCGAMETGWWVTYLPGKPDETRYHTPPDYVPAGLWERWNHGNSQERLTCRAMLLEMLTTLLFEGETSEDLRPHIPSFLSRSQDILIDISHQPIDTMPSVRNALEDRLEYSYEHICRSFKKHLGITPLGFVNALRMERAKLLLRVTQSSIQQIAARVGFDSQGYFSRRFHAHVGTTPRQFRLDCRK